MNTTADTGTDYALPFGKHKGQWVCDIPTAYLLYLVENVPIQSMELLQAIRDENEFRQQEGEHSRGIEDRAAWKRGERVGSRDVDSKTDEALKIQLVSVLQRWHTSALHALHPDKNKDKLPRVVFQEFQKQALALREALKEIGVHVELRL